MSEFRYSPEPASFYTLKVQGETVGVGSGLSAIDVGFWNLTWLTCIQCDEYEKPSHLQNGLPIWTPEYQQPYLETAAYKLSGMTIVEFAACLKAETFVDVIANHVDFKQIPLYKQIGPAWLIAILDRSKKSADIPVSDQTHHQRVLIPPKAGPDLTPQTIQRGKVISMKDWLEKLHKA